MTLNRKTKQGINFFYTILIIIGIFFLINYIASSIFFSWDITQNKDYSVSDVSKETLKNLDDIINIKVFFSNKVPSNLISLKQDVKDIINEYKKYSKGKLKVTYVDPDNDNLKKEAKSLGIPEVQFSTLEKDKYEVSNGYLGIAVMYGDKKEIIPFVENTKNFEYDLTTAIKKVLQEKSSTVAFLEGHNELSAEKELRYAAQYLKKIYNLTTVSLSEGNLIDKNIDTLIIAGAKSELSQWDKYAIDQFLMNGKSLLILQDGINVDEKTLDAGKDKSGISSLLEFYGVKLNNNLILDPSCVIVRFSNGFREFFEPYLYWTKIEKGGFNQDNVVVNQLESAVFPWVSSLDFIDSKLQGKEVVKIISSSNKSWAQENPGNLNPEQKPEVNNPGVRTLGAILSGKFTSYFKDKEKPNQVKKAGSTLSATDFSESKKDFKSETDSGRIIVIGDSDFITDDYISRFQPNLLLFQNAVDALTIDEALIKIRSKGISDRPIRETSDSTKTAVKFFNIFGMTIIVLAAGLIRYFLRKRTKFADKI